MISPSRFIAAASLTALLGACNSGQPKELPNPECSVSSTGVRLASYTVGDTVFRFRFEDEAHGSIPRPLAIEISKVPYQLIGENRYQHSLPNGQVKTLDPLLLIESDIMDRGYAAGRHCEKLWKQ